MLARTLTSLFLFISLVLSGCQQSSPPHQTTGYVEANLVYLAAPFGGTLQKLNIKLGATVKKNQRLFTLNPQPQSAQLQTAKAKQQQAQAVYDRVRNSINRAALKAAKAQVTGARWAVTAKSVNAPQAGHIANIYYQVGEFVPPGRPVLSLLVARKKRVVFYVPETALAKLKLGHTVRITCDGCKKAIKGRIVFIAKRAAFTPDMIFDRANRQTLVFRVRASIPSKAPLNPGQPIDVNYE